MKIYAFDMTGYEGNCSCHLYNDKEYSEQEYFDICAKLYVEENENILKMMREGGVDEENLDVYNSASSIYNEVANRLEKEYGFKSITIFSDFCIDEYASFKSPKDNTEFSKAIDTIRKKYFNREREKKLKRILK